MKNDDLLRCCSQNDEPYIWYHPGDSFDGKVMPGREWHEMPCWIRDDMALDLKDLNAGMFERVHLLAEIDDLLERASSGQLQEDGGFVRAPRDATRTHIDSEVIELRIREPFDVKGHRCRSRIYCFEPVDDRFSLVSLGSYVKQVDCARWRELQDDFIQKCSRRKNKRRESFPFSRRPM